MDGIERRKVNGGAIEIYSPKELSRLVTAASEDYLPCLTIAAFSGLRTAEIQRLDLGNIHLAERFIEVSAAKAKTASRRLAPIPDNLAAWLAPYADRKGEVWPYGYFEFYRAQARCAQNAGIPWKRNALRHSFISYRLAALQDVARVALEAGNSPQMIFQHYRELVRPRDAKAWFSIMPSSAENVVLVKA